MSLTFRTVTIIEGPEIDVWLERQDVLDPDERDLRDAVRWWTAYRLLGGVKNLKQLLQREQS